MGRHLFNKQIKPSFEVESPLGLNGILHGNALPFN